MTQNINIILTGSDEASAPIASGMQKITASTNDATQATKMATQSTKDAVVGFSGVAVAAFGVVMSYENINRSQVMLDRANVMVQKSTNALQSAQEAYNKALADGDPQKIADALAKLNTAQDSLTVIQERAQLSQESYNNSLMQFGLMIIPSAITAAASFSKIMEQAPYILAAVDGATTTLNISMAGLAISAAAGVGAFAIGYTVLNSLPEPMKQTAAVLAIVTGALAAAAIAAAVLWGTISVGTALPAILIAVGVAVAGVTLALQGGTKAATDNAAANTTAADSLAALTTAEKTATDAETKRYNTDITNYEQYWSDYLGLTATSLSTVQDEITTFYNNKIKIVTDFAQTEIDTLNTAYKQELTDYTDSWAATLGLTQTELTKVNAEITSYYDAQIKVVQDAAQKEVDALNTAYAKELTDYEKHWADILGLTTTELTKVNAEINAYYDKQIKIVTDDSQKEVDTLQTTYDKELTDYESHWADVLGLTSTSLTKVNAEINTYYDTQLNIVTDGAQKEVDTLQTAYDKELTDFVASWDKKLDVHNTALDQVDSAINTHYDKQAADIKTKYTGQTKDLNDFYDGLVTSTNAGLDALTAANQKSNDAAEAAMLQKKKVLEISYSEGLINEGEYNNQVNALTTEYNTKKATDQDTFRLAQISAEAEATPKLTAIAQARKDALAGVATQEQKDLITVTDSRNTDLIAADAGYQTIAVTDANTLNAAIATIRTDEKTAVDGYNADRKTDLAAADAGYYKIATTDANTLSDAIAAIRVDEKTAVDTYNANRNTDLKASDAGYQTIAVTDANTLSGAIATIRTDEKTAVDGYNADRNNALIAADAGYQTIAVTDLATLNGKIAGLTQDKTDMVDYLTTEMYNNLETARQQDEALELTYQTNLTAIDQTGALNRATLTNTNAATERTTTWSRPSTTTATASTPNALQNTTTDPYGINLFKGSPASGGTPNASGGAAPTLSGASGTPAPAVSKATVVTSQVLAGYTSFSDPKALAAAIAADTKQINGVYNDALDAAAGLGANKHWTPQNISSLQDMIPHFAGGIEGVTTGPTLALVGESGPEKVSIQPVNKTSNEGDTTNNFSVTINIEGSVDQKILMKLKEELKTVVIEASSANAPSNSKRIRLGSRMF